MAAAPADASRLRLEGAAGRAMRGSAGCSHRAAFSPQGRRDPHRTGGTGREARGPGGRRGAPAGEVHTCVVGCCS